MSLRLFGIAERRARARVASLGDNFERNTQMNILLKIAAITTASMLALTSAHAGTKLQLQFQRWVYENSELTSILATVRNPTTMDFARVVWDCNFHDKDKRLVGRDYMVFNQVLWGALVVQKNIVRVTGGMFETSNCTLLKAEERTYENERLYRSRKYYDVQLGLALPEADSWFSFDHPIQGQAVVITEEESNKLNELRKKVAPGSIVLRSAVRDSR